MEICTCSHSLRFFTSCIDSAGRNVGVLWWISEDTAGGIGVIVLLLIVGGAVASFILNGMQLEKYEYLEKEVFSFTVWCGRDCTKEKRGI